MESKFQISLASLWTSSRISEGLTLKVSAMLKIVQADVGAVITALIRQPLL